MRVVVAAFAAAALAGECSAWSGAATVGSSYGVRSLSMMSSREPQQGGGLMSRRAATAGLAAALLAGGTKNARAEGEAPKIPESEMIKPPTTSCAQGVGAKCEELSEGNPLIKKLQERSAKNRLKYQKEELESYWRKNYKDFFDAACTGYDQKCDFRENSDGTWSVGVKDNRIKLQEREN